MTRLDLLIWMVMVVLCSAMIIWSWIYFAPGARKAAGDGAASAVMSPRDFNLRAPRFVFTDQRGERFDSADLLGRVWIVDFIFTNCPGPCPIMTGNLRMLQQAIGQADDLHLVSITCDPWRDTPETLAAYAAAFGADQSRWSFLTGEFAEIQRCARELLLSVANPREEAQRQAEGGPSGAAADHAGPIVHSSRFVLIGPDGFVREWYSGTEAEEMERLLADTRALLATIGAGPASRGAVDRLRLIRILPACNAALNGLAAVLLMCGLRLIRSGRRDAHQRCMIGAFLVSVVFLVSYITYHTLRQMEEGLGHTKWEVAGAWQKVYYAILISHVILAATVPFLAGRTLYLAACGRFDAHRRIARVTWPIWMYVAVTGVIVYFMLYHLHPALKATAPVQEVLDAWKPES